MFGNGIFEMFKLLLLIGTFLPGLVSTRRCDMIQTVGDEVEEVEMICEKDSTFCYAFWKYSNETGDVVFMKQGCWKSSPTDSCENHNCVASKIRPDKTLFCCCAADNCNSNVTFVPSEEEEDEFPEFGERMGIHSGIESGFEQKSIITLPIMGLLIILTLILFFGCVGFAFIWRNNLIKLRNETKNPLVIIDLEAGEKLMEPLNKTNYEVTDPVALSEEIAKGKFATVCAGRSGGVRVALKVFPTEHKEYFENEKYIFQCLGNSVHPNIVGYKGWQAFTVGSSTNLILILDRISPGNLRDFLSDDTTAPLDVPQTLKIMKGLASGLSFLHGENSDGVVIAHRDLTSKNILIDKNLNPYIADFGLSLRTKGSRYYFSGLERQAEFCSLSDAGTLRYMAPELLEGAVNLKDLENSLKQADIYALALLIWEIVNKSAIAINNCHVLPYSPELGKDISIEALTRLVCTRRGRPSFSNWYDSAVARSLRESLQEAWDPEPDARLTALCIVERMSDLENVQLLNNKNSTVNCSTPLESQPESFPHLGRNKCLERNLMEEISDTSTMYLLTSEKHRVNFYNGGHSSSVGTTVESLATTNTDLSNGSSPAPPPINYLHNIRR